MLKRYLQYCTLLAVTMILPDFARSQNMVPNGDFEYYNPCPTGASQITNCTGWLMYSPSSDYFNVCAPTAVTFPVSVPTNWPGTQSPASGNGYAGFAVNTTSVTGGFREAIARTITPLTPGVTYEVSMSISLADNSRYAIDKIGAYFYINSPSSVSANYIAATTPQVSFASYGTIADKTNWVRVTRNFIADSAYNHIAITGFGPQSAFKIDTLTGANTYAYYYVDSVVVKVANPFTVSLQDTLLCAGGSFLATYNINPSKTFNTGNVFTAQLSDATGSFASPVNIGSVVSIVGGTISCIIPQSTPPGTGYRIRVISNNNPDTSLDNGKNIQIITLMVNAGLDTAICENDTLKINAVGNFSPMIYNWAGPAGFTSTQQKTARPHAKPDMTGNYIMTAIVGNCVAKDTVLVTVKPFPINRQVKVDSTPVCAGKTITITAYSASAGTTFSWLEPGNFTAPVANIFIGSASQADSGMYYITYTLAGCSITDSVLVQVNPLPIPVTLSSNSPVCEPQALQINSTGSLQGSSYTWTGPKGFSYTGQNLERLPTDTNMSGNYSILLSLNGCTRIDSIPVVVLPSPRDIVLQTDIPVCKDDTLIISIDSIEQKVLYEWNGPANFKSYNPNVSIQYFSKNKEGLYTLTSSIGGCKKTKELYVELIDPVPHLYSDTLLCENDTLMLNVAVNTAEYSWQDKSTTSSFTIKQAGTYWVTATTKCGVFSDSIKADYHICECIPFVPSAFTPNNDGLNDKLPTIIDCKWTDYKMLIVNRFGQEVFKSTNPAIKWDGTFKGEPADVGTYFYMLQIKGPHDKDYFFKGDIVLIR
ncbi:MAG: gliding motility-associated C-terminal domain-containing protein [Bacteroidetes bacterium]|nr:gliding motility-associated C-terminal domain-containing protein [Bacteroidota bacterium]